MRVLTKIAAMLRIVFFSMVMFLAIFPSVMKIYETSHWFREGDPSVYDNAKDWFKSPAIPFQSYFESSKVLMRVYFFIVPYIFSALLLALALMLPPSPSRKKISPWTNVSYHSIQKSRQKVGSFLRMIITLPSFVTRFGSIFPNSVSTGELIGVGAFLVLNIMTMAVRVRRSLPRGSRKITFLIDSDEDASREAINAYSWQACEIWAKTLGVISIMNLGWYLLMPIGRKSFLLEALGLSWERAVKYHRWIGNYSVAVMVIHSVLYVMVWMYGDGHANFDPNGQMLQSNLVPWYCSQQECSVDEARMLRINMYGFATLALILIMTIFALPTFRRHRFELFYYIHHLFIMVLIFVCLHYKGSIIYIIPGIAIYAVDKLMALHSYSKTAPVASRMLSSDVLEVSFNIKSGVQYQAGDYVFLNVPSVSHLQWHPFSLTSAPTVHGNKVFFHLKDSGSWSKSVIEEAKNQDDGLLQVRLDGFYGVSSGSICAKFQDMNGVILVGGGIGITPMISLAMELCNTNPLLPINLMWVVRTIDDFGIFSEELVDAQYSHENFKAKVWITMSGEFLPEQSNTCSGVNTGSELFSVHDSMKKVAFVKQCLETIKASHNPRDIKSSVFELDKPSLTGGANAFVMAMSMFVATFAYALSAKTANRETFSDTTQDKISLMDLSLVNVFVLVWITVVIMSRSVFTRYLGEKDNKYSPAKSTTRKDEDNTAHTVDISNHILSNTNHSLSSWRPKNNEDVERSTQVEDKHIIMESMIEGRIGSRPNIADEFSNVSRTVAESADKDAAVDIAVMACGPPKLVESINNYANAPRSTTEKKKSKATFVFTEEDWEW